MNHKVLALLTAGAIIVSSIWVVQGQFKIGRPITIKPVIHSYIYENIFNGANQLRTARTELAKIPTMVSDMYQELEKNRPLVQEGIKGLEGIISNLGATKKEIDENKMIIRTIKTPLLAALKTLEETLPTLLGVLKNLDAAFSQTIQERAAVVQDLKGRADSAIGSIDGKDVLGNDLPTRMDNLGNGLKGLSV